VLVGEISELHIVLAGQAVRGGQQDDAWLGVEPAQLQSRAPSTGSRRYATSARPSCRTLIWSSHPVRTISTSRSGCVARIRRTCSVTANAERETRP